MTRINTIRQPEPDAVVPITELTELVKSVLAYEDLKIDLTYTQFVLVISGQEIVYSGLEKFMRTGKVDFGSHGKYEYLPYVRKWEVVR